MRAERRRDRAEARHAGDHHGLEAVRAQLERHQVDVRAVQRLQRDALRRKLKVRLVHEVLHRVHNLPQHIALRELRLEHPNYAISVPARAISEFPSRQFGTL